MSESATKQTLIALNSTEWLNLCARGSIRIVKRRAIAVPMNATTKDLDKVFAVAPFTKVSSAVDLFVLEVPNSWTKTAAKHRSMPSEVSILNLADVVFHHPVSQAHFEHYKNKGLSCGVDLQEAKFERAWLSWTMSETVKDALRSVELLQKSLGIKPLSEIKRPDRYKWEDLVRLALRPNEPIKPKPAHVETLISGIRKLADAVAGSTDSESFYLACAIEWVDLRLKKDPMKKKSTRELLNNTLGKLKDVPLAEPSSETIAALKHLSDSFPKAFTEEISALSIAHAVRFVTAARSKRLKPEIAIQMFNSIDKSSSTSVLLSFLLAVSLDVELTNQFIRASTKQDFAEMNWDLPN